MKKSTKVYKVVRQVGGNLVSPFSYNQCQYGVGQTTVAPEGTRLFAFAKLADARKYADVYGETKVFRATATGKVKSGWLFYHMDNVAGRFFDVLETPEKEYPSAVVCETIRLTSEVV